MLNATPRFLAIGTVGILAVIAITSNVFGQLRPGAIWSTQNISGYDCQPLDHDHAGFHPGYGYGYDCLPPGPGGGNNPGGPGGPSPVPVFTNYIPPVVTDPSDDGRMHRCAHSLKDLTDPRLTSFYPRMGLTDVTQPGRAVSRAEFLQYVLSTAKIDVSSESDPEYTDVNSSHNLKQYIAYATRTGLLSGHNGQFRPDDTISRAEAAKVFVHASGLSLSTGAIIFSDVPNTHSLAAHIQTAFDGCLLDGRHTRGGVSLLPNGERRYEPSDIITVAETAKVLYNIVHQ